MMEAAQLALLDATTATATATAASCGTVPVQQGHTRMQGHTPSPLAVRQEVVLQDVDAGD